MKNQPSTDPRALLVPPRVLPNYHSIAVLVGIPAQDLTSIPKNNPENIFTKMGIDDTHFKYNISLIEVNSWAELGEDPRENLVYVKRYMDSLMGMLRKMGEYDNDLFQVCCGMDLMLDIYDGLKTTGAPHSGWGFGNGVCVYESGGHPYAHGYFDSPTPIPNKQGIILLEYLKDKSKQ